jgi:hypothetical protein
MPMTPILRALLLPLVAHAQDPVPYSYTVEWWSAPYEHVEVLCHVVVPDGAGHNWGFALPDPETGSVPTDVVTLDPDRMAQRLEELDLGDAKAEGEPWEARSVIYGPLVCQRYQSYRWARVDCTSVDVCTDPDWSRWDCTSDEPQALAQFSRLTATLVLETDYACNPNPPEPDPHY